MSIDTKIVYVTGDSGIDHIAIKHKRDFSSDHLFLESSQSGYWEDFKSPSGADFLQQLIKKILNYDNDKDKSGANRSDKGLQPSDICPANWETFSEWEISEADKKLKEIDCEFKYNDGNKAIECHLASLKTYFGVQNKKPSIGRHLYQIPIVNNKSKNIVSIFNNPLPATEDSNTDKIFSNNVRDEIRRIKDATFILRTKLFSRNNGTDICYKHPMVLEELFTPDTDKLNSVILLFSMSELQHGSIIEKPVSWEQIFMATKRCINKIPYFEKYKAIVALFSSYGALLFQPQKNIHEKYRLFYYESDIGELSRERISNPLSKSLFGVAPVIQAVITAALTYNWGTEYNNSLEYGIEAGLMMALLPLDSYRLLVDKASYPPYIKPVAISFPANTIAKKTNEVFLELKNRSKNFKGCCTFDKCFEKFKEIENSLECKFPSSILIDENIDLSNSESGKINSLLKCILTKNINIETDDEKIDVKPLNKKGGKIAPFSSLELEKDNLLFQFCAQIVRRGAVVPLFHQLHKIVPPYLHLSNLLSYDKNQIEQICDTYNVLKSYIRSPNKRKPLSICVFGPEGTGKSFSVSQIAQHLNINKKKDQNETEILNVNLSQFDSYEQLIDAFHKIRDVGLRNKLPVVFFDEFDTAYGINRDGKYGWLRFFLSPMQDGEFYEKGQTHTIGRAIFVFAGSTVETMQAFIKIVEDVKTDEEKDEIRAKKMPDFISRIKGYLDVSGPNNSNKESGTKILHYIRRASILRSMLAEELNIKNADSYIGITDLALKMLLNVKKYKHGARSMEAIASEFDSIRSISLEAIYKSPSRLALLHLEDDGGIEKYF